MIQGLPGPRSGLASETWEGTVVAPRNSANASAEALRGEGVICWAGAGMGRTGMEGAAGLSAAADETWATGRAGATAGLGTGASVSGVRSQMLVRRVMGMGSSPAFEAAARWMAG